MNIKLGREKQRLLFHIVVIGAGANGSHFIRSLCQDVATYRKEKRYFYHTSYECPFDYQLMIVDADRVEKKNLNNQLYDEDDIGEFKVHALAARYGDHYNIDIRSIAEYVTTMEKLEQLFSFVKEVPRAIPILVGMVDNNRTRMLLHDFFHSDYLSELIYIDAGVEGVLLEEELQEQPEDVRKRWIQSSGFSGQIVIGYKRDGQVFLPPVADVYPTILTDEESIFPDQSCGDAILNNPQRGATNKMAAQLANSVINNLFHSGEIFQNEITFNAQFGTAQARFVPKHIEREYEKLFKESEEHGTLSAIS